MVITVAPWPDHLLTREERDELPEDEFGRSELVDGVLVITPAGFRITGSSASTSR
jgi:hypothetical protein